MGYQIISLKDREKWKQCVDQATDFDFHHTWHYHSIEKTGEPIMFLYQEGDLFIGLPLLLREIDNTGYYDLTSVYGYAGPISNKKFEEIDNQYLESFKTEFLKYLNDEKIVSVFSRLHPIINQAPLLEKFGGVFDNGKTVDIDLDIDIDDQRARYEKGHRIRINKLRNKNYQVKEVQTPEEVSAFVSIYHENMRRVNAAQSYFFDEDYFNAMLNSDEFSAKILLVYAENTPIAGGFFTFTNDIIQVHLLATRNEYLNESPAKLLVDEASVIGRALGMKHVHLGGGVGAKNDSLFNWKSGFSSNHLNFSTWRFISDPITYNQLVERNSKLSEGITEESDFFPLYRKAIA